MIKVSSGACAPVKGERTIGIVVVVDSATVDSDDAATVEPDESDDPLQLATNNPAITKPTRLVFLSIRIFTSPLRVRFALRAVDGY